MNQFKKACLTVGLATAWFGAPQTQADPVVTVNVNVAPTNSLSDAYFFIFGFNNSVPQVVDTLVGNIPAGPNSLTLTLPDPFDDSYYNNGGTISGYELMGLYSANGVTLSDHYPGDTTFNTQFPTDEPQIVTALSTGDTGTLDDFVDSNSYPLVDYFSDPTPTALLDFSTPTPGGTVSAQIVGVSVPEPASVSVLALGASGLLLRRRRIHG